MCDHIRVAKECSAKCKILNRHEKVDGCWIWTGKIGKNGYGSFAHIINGHKKFVLAHRMSYETFIGEIPKGLNVCHKCDNRKCVNPDHLWIGSQEENIHDAEKKGRMKRTTGYKHTEENKARFKLRRGEKAHKVKLKEKQVIRIKKMLKSNLTIREISEKFNVSATCISSIKQGINWKHLNEICPQEVL